MMTKRILTCAFVLIFVFNTFGTNVALAMSVPEESSETTQTETEPSQIESSQTEPTVEVVTPVPTTIETSEPTNPSEDEQAVETTAVPEETEPTEESVPTEETEATDATEPTEETEAPLVPFDATVTVDGIQITVTADDGVFPEGAYLSAEKVDGEVVNQNDNLVSSMTFDISIHTEDGVEIEPDTAHGEVHVSFVDNRFADSNLDASIYHIQNDEPVEMEYEVDGNEATASTDGFSLYTVEFTYDDMQYVLSGDTSVALSEILNAVGLTGDVTNVTVSDSSLIGVSESNGTYTVSALQAFSSNETMTVTINSIDYVIDITDDEYIPQNATAGVDAYAILYTSGKLVIQKGDTPIASEGDVSVSGLINADASDLPWAGHEGDVDQVYFRDNLVGMTSLKNFFAGMTNITSLDLSRLDSSDVTTFSGLFSRCTNLDFESVNLNVLDRSSLTDISGMFNDCDNLHSIDLTGWVTSQVVSTSGLINGCDNLTNIVLDNWDLAGMTGTGNMSGMLSVSASNINVSCKNWQNIPADFSHGFGRTLGITYTTTVNTLDVSNWDLAETTDITGLFANLRVNKIVGLDSWNTSNITNMNQLFYDCSLSDYSDVYDWNMSNVTNIAQMFGSSNAVTLDLSNWDTHNVTVFAQGSFIGPNTTTLILDNWDFSGIDSFLGNGFLGNTVLTTLSMRNCTNLPDFTGTDSIGRAMSGGGCHFETIDVTGWDLSRCTSLNGVFANITVDNLVGYETWDTSHIQNFSQVFCYTKGLTDIDISAWDFSSATTVSYMFSADSTGTDVESIKLPTSFTSKFALSDTDIQSISQAFRVGDTINLVEDFTTSNQVAGTYTPVNVTVLDPRQGTLTMPSNRLLGTNDIPVFLWDDTYRDTLPDEDSIVRTNYTFFGWEDADGVEYTDSSASFPATLSAKWDNYIPQDATAGVDLYRMVYKNSDGQNTYVYQKGNTPHDEDLAAYGTNTGAYLVYPTQQLSVGSYQCIFRDNILGMTRLYLITSSNSVPVDVIGLERIDTSTVTTLGGTNGSYGSPLFSPNITSIAGCENWDLSNVVDMSYAFSGGSFPVATLYDLTPVSNWDVSHVTNMSRIFYDSIIDDYSAFSNWNTSNVTNLSYAFCGSNVLDTDAFANWNTGNVTNMNHIFHNCSNLASTSGISNWDTTKVTSLESAFEGCSAISRIVLNWSLPAATNMNSMFKNCSALTRFEGDGTWTATAASNSMAYLFANDKVLVDISGVSGWDTSNATSLSYAFDYCQALEDLTPVEDWNTANVTDMSYIFDRCSHLYSLEKLANWNTESVTTFKYAFYYCSTLADISGVSDWDVSDVASMSYMFAYDTKITNLDAMTDWTTSSLTDVSAIFAGCSSLQSIAGLADWDMSHVTTMESMFYGDRSITNADAIRNWTTPALTNYESMFYNCSKIPELDFSNWDMSHLGDANRRSSNTLYGCTRLIKISLPASFTIHSNDAGIFDRYSSGDTIGHTVFDTEWLFDGDNQMHDMNAIIANFTAENAGTYYKTYSVQLYPMGGTVDPMTIETSLATGVDSLPTPVRDNYTFDGWYDSTGVERTSIAPGEYVTKLFARWTSNGTYTLVLESGREDVDNVVVHLEYEELYQLDSSIFGTIDGFRFSHWSARSAGTGTRYDNGDYVSKLANIGEEYHLYANWLSNAEIPVKAHIVNLITGEETNFGTVTVRLNTPVSPDALMEYVPTPDSNDRFMYISYASDLDCVHYDGTGIKEGTTQDWTWNNVDDYGNYLDPDNHVLGVTYSTMTAERSRVVTGSWTADDYNVDVYLYYLPAVRVRVYFNEYQTANLPDALVMTVDGQQYRSGEYVGSFAPSFYGGMPSSTELYTPNYYGQRPWSCSLSSLCETSGTGLGHVLETATFNYPIFWNSYFMWALDENPFYLTTEGYWSYRSSQHYYNNHMFTEELSVQIGFDAGVFYDYNDGTGRYTSDRLYLGSGTHYDLTQLTNKPYNSRISREGYAFNGWWTAPEGGMQVIGPNENRNQYSDVFNMLNCDSFSAPIYNSQSALPGFRLYAQWVSEDEAPDDTGYERAMLVIHDSHRYESVRTEYIQPPCNLKNHLDDPDATEYTDNTIFVGYFTEPNGQGDQVTIDTVVPRGTTRLDVYAYWKEPDSKIYFQPYGSADSPNNASVIMPSDAWSNFFDDSKLPYSLGFDTVSSVADAYMIPFVTTAEPYNFLGWFDADGNKLEAGTELIAGATYYGHWEHVVSDGITYTMEYHYADNSTYYNMPAANSESLPTIVLDFAINSTDEILPKGSVRIYFPNIYYIQNQPTVANVAAGQYFIRQNGYIDSNTYGYWLENGVDITGSAQVHVEYTPTAYYNIGGRNAAGSEYSPSRDLVATVYQLPVNVAIDKGKDGTIDITDNRVLYFESVPASKYSAFQDCRVTGTASTSWNSSWGTAPADAADYFYVEWRLVTYNNSPRWNNTNLNWYYSPVDSDNDGEIVNPREYVHNDDTYSSNGDYIIMRYPKANYNLDTQRANIAQNFVVCASPEYPYRDGQQFDYVINRSATAVINWQEGYCPASGDVVWANAGRMILDNNSSYKWKYDDNSVHRSLARQRQFVLMNENVGEFRYFDLYARRRTGDITDTAISVGPGDFSYSSTVADDYFMLDPMTGRTYFNEDDYYISSVAWYCYNGYSEEFANMAETATGQSASDIIGKARTTPVEVYVQRRGSSEWVLYESSMGQTSDLYYNDGHVSCTFQNYRIIYFNRDTDIVGVKVVANYDDSNYQILQLCPCITLIPNARTQQIIAQDFNQNADSAIAENDFHIGRSDSMVSYVSGQWAYPTLVFDGDIGLTTWYLSSDVTPLDEYVNIIYGNSYAGTYQTQVYVEAVNKASSTTYYEPIDSGTMYILLPEHCSYRFNGLRSYGTNKANTSFVNYMVGERITHYANSYSDSFSSSMYNIEEIPNWEGSGRTMLKIDVAGGDSLRNPFYRNSIVAELTLTRPALDTESYGFSGDMAAMFIATDGQVYANNINRYDSYNDNSLIHRYFSNLNADNQAAVPQTAYVNVTGVQFKRPANTPDDIVWQDGFNEYIANSTGEWGGSTTVYPGEDFSYFIRYSQDSQAWLRNAVLYTRLDDVGLWKSASFPTLTGSYAISDTEWQDVAVSPVVWYCTDPNFSLDDVSSIVYDSAHGWTQTEPVGQMVYGVVLDYSHDADGHEVTFRGNLNMPIYIYQKNGCMEEHTFTSETIIVSDSSWLSASVTGGVMTGSIEFPTLGIDITSIPASGTADAPRDVSFEQDIVYNIDVQNNGARAVNNVVVSVDVPSAVACDLSTITVGGIPISESPKISNASINDGKLTFTINTLRRGEVVTVVENTYVNIRENGVLITNTGVIESYNDMTLTDDLKFRSGTTYHITLTIPEPTGFVDRTMPYVCIFGGASILLAVFFHKRKKEDDAEVQD